MSKKRKGSWDAVKEVCRERRLKVEDLFKEAAAWVREAFGRRIKQGAVREAIGKYHNKGKIPDWVKSFIVALRHNPALA